MGASKPETDVSRVEIIDTAPELEPKLHAKTYLIVLTVALVYFAQVINLVGAGAYRLVIAAAVGGSDKAIWLITATTIGVVVLGPPVSQAADYWGRRWFLIIATACGFVGAIIVSRAQSMNVAIAGEVILSASYAAQPLLHTVASEVLTHRHRVAGQAAVNVGSGMGGVVGLLAGAALTSENPEGFRNFWYMNAGIYALAVVMLFALYRPPPRELQLSMTLKEKLHRLDWVGYVLLAIGLVLFVMGLSWANNPYPWSSAYVLGPLLVGAAFAVALIIYEWKFKKDGMVHHGLFSKDRNCAIALTCIFAEGLVFFGANGFFPYQVAVVYSTDSLMVSLHFVVAFLMYTLACPLLSVYCYKTKRLRIPAIFAFSCFLAFNVCMATTTPGSSTAVWGYPILLGTGLATALCALVTAAQLSAPPELISTTSGLMTSMRSLGGAIGLAIYTAIFSSRLIDLPTNIAATVVPLGLPPSSVPLLVEALLSGEISQITKIKGINAKIIAAAFGVTKQGYVNSFQGVWITASCFAVVAVIAACFILDPKADFNSKIDAPAEREAELYGDGVIVKS